MKATYEELENTIAGASTTSILNAVARFIKTIYEIGYAVGKGLYNAVNGQIMGTEICK